MKIKVSVTFFNKILMGAFLFLALAGRPAFCDEPAEGMHEGHAQQIFSQLNLTDDQKKQLEANKDQHRAAMQSARQEIKSVREELKAELMKSSLDMARINALQTKIKSLLTQMEDNKLNSILAVRGILTPDQFTKFISLMPKHKGDHD